MEIRARFNLPVLYFCFVSYPNYFMYFDFTFFFTAGLCEKYDVKGFPTFNLYSNGELVEKYTGGRMTGDFAFYMTELPDEVEMEYMEQDTSEKENLAEPEEKEDLRDEL